MIARQKRAKTLQLVAVYSALPPYASCKDEASLKADGTNANTGHHSWESNPASLLSPFCLCCFNFTPAKSPWITSLSSALTYIPACFTHPFPSVILCVRLCVCPCEEKCGCAGVFALFYRLKHSAEPRPSYHVPYSIPLLVRVNGAQNTYHLLPTCVNKPLAPPQATVSLTLHLLSCSLHALTIFPPL